jgi:N-acetylmuramoyl-L-alanine amidase
MKPEHIIIHHTATARDTTRFQSVRDYHVNVNGWKDVGYHYFIESDGTIYAGRMENETGAHCRAQGMNGKSIGIALTGDFTNDLPTDKQKKSLQRLVNSIQTRHNIESVLGHREVDSGTLCPGISVDELLKNTSE